MTVGGRKTTDNQQTNELLTYNDVSKHWKKTFPAMPTARDSLGVISLRSSLVAAGGMGADQNYCSAVEVLNCGTLQWHRSHPMPFTCCDLSLVCCTTDKICYTVGGFRHAHLNQALCASTEDIIHNTLPCQGAEHCLSVWKALPGTPAYGSSSAILTDKLLAIGGIETSKKGAAKKEVYMYSLSTNSWVYISDLPSPLSRAAVAIMSPAEILVVGGRGSRGERVNAVYRGNLCINV